MSSTLDLIRLYGIPVISLVNTLLSEVLRYLNTDQGESNTYTIAFAVMLTGFISSLCLLCFHCAFPLIYRNRNTFLWWVFGIFVLITICTQILGFGLSFLIVFESKHRAASVPLVIFSGISMCLSLTLCFFVWVFIQTEDPIPLNSVPLDSV